MSARSELLVLDYLSRAADAARGTLRSDERMRFITTLRVSIEQQRRATGAAEPPAVRRVLATFGDPAVLVAGERRRLDQAKSVDGDAAGTGTPDPAAQRAAESAARGAAARGAAAPGAAENGRTGARTPENGSATPGMPGWGTTEHGPTRLGASGLGTAGNGAAGKGAAGNGAGGNGAGGGGRADPFTAGQRRVEQGLAEHGAPGWARAEDGCTVRRAAQTAGAKLGTAESCTAESCTAEWGTAEHGTAALAAARQDAASVGGNGRAESGAAEARAAPQGTGTATHGAVSHGAAGQGAAVRRTAGQGTTGQGAASMGANGRAEPGVAEVRAAPQGTGTATHGAVRQGAAGRGGAGVGAGGSGRAESGAAEWVTVEQDASRRNPGGPPESSSRSPSVLRPGDVGRHAAAPTSPPGQNGGADRGSDRGASRSKGRQMWVSAGKQAPALRQPLVAGGRQRTGGTRRDATGSRTGGSGGGPSATQPDTPGQPDPAGRRQGPVPVGGPPVRAVPQVAFDPMSVVGRFPREMLSLVLLGLGGLLLPFPLWLIGAVIGLTSRVWSTRDKFIGIAGALIITVAGVGVIGALNKNPSIPVDLHAYFAAAHADSSLLMRFGAVLGAIYLGARLPRGDRPSPYSRRSADRRRDLPGGR